MALPQRPTSLTSLLRSTRVRGLLYQCLVVGVVVGLGWYLVHNTLTNLALRGIATGFDFLGREAGFDIGEGPIDYASSDSYGRAIVVGLLNTLSVSIWAILAATVLGTLVGIGRLSDNWLVSRLSGLYVEAVRNVPLLLQLFVWYGLVTALPGPRQAVSLGAGVFLSNRGFKFPAPMIDGPAWPFYGAVVLAVAGGGGLMIWSARRRAAGQYGIGVFRYAAALLVGAPVAALLASGAGVTWDVPHLAGFNFRGGMTVSPEFAALWAGLTIYTASFIAEVVRSGILAVPKGQTEAALSLGLSRGQILRLVVLPQALRVIVPPLSSQYLNLLKNSSLAVAIGYPDLVSVANTSINQTGQAVEGVALVMVVFVGLSLSLSLLMNWYNAKIVLVTR